MLMYIRSLQKGTAVYSFPKLTKMKPLFQGALQRPYLPEFTLERHRNER